MKPEAPIRKTIHILRREAHSAQPWYWHVTLGNGEIVATGEQYEHRADMIRMLGHLFDLDAEELEILNEVHVVHWSRAEAE